MCWSSESPVRRGPDAIRLRPHAEEDPLDRRRISGRPGTSRPCWRGSGSRTGSWRGTAGGYPRSSNAASWLSRCHVETECSLCGLQLTGHRRVVPRGHPAAYRCLCASACVLPSTPQLRRKSCIPRSPSSFPSTQTTDCRSPVDRTFGHRQKQSVAHTLANQEIGRTSRAGQQVRECAPPRSDHRTHPTHLEAASQGRPAYCPCMWIRSL